MLDLAWRRAGHGRWIAGRTEQGDRLLARFPNATARAGLIVRDRIIEWDLSAAAQMPDLPKQISRWEQDVRQDLAHHARVKVANGGVDEGALVAVQDALADGLTRHGWAFRSKAPLAWGLAGARRLTPGQARLAHALLTEARDVVAAVDRRLAQPAAPKDVAAARDPDVRADLLAACRHLSGLDGDRARDRNGAGWSAVASAEGHRLASTDSLDVVQAAHVRQLVHAHRRQLPPALRDQLFPEA
ncbi:hypothetical protein ACFQE0_14135 [Methylobacterium komagatae]|uniref:Uncharacterized protein n=1 Tax=Methylobacterium komagatae TaxID=374425 RepID=A0ABW2BLN8_9HYPH